MPISAVHAEMDRVWYLLGLDNLRPLSQQTDRVARFYAHPVWVLNGLFTRFDPDSLRHREAIAAYISHLAPHRIADFGGGSGALAELLASRANASIDVVEPFPHAYFVNRLRSFPQVRYRPELDGDCDVAVAMDVLEHVDDPVAIMLELVRATRAHGTLVFANCFYPVVACHLPGTFFLRHLFPHVARSAGLVRVGRVPGAPYAEVFRRERALDIAAVAQAERWARRGGPGLNRIRELAAGLTMTLRVGTGIP